MKKMQTTLLVVLALGLLVCGTSSVMSALAPGQQRLQNPAPALLDRVDDGEKTAREASNKALPDIPEETLKAMLASVTGGGKLNQLLKDQLEAARTEGQQRMKMFLAGQGTLDILFSSSERIVQAELDLSLKQSHRLAVWEAHLCRLNAINDIMELVWVP